MLKTGKNGLLFVFFHFFNFFPHFIKLNLSIECAYIEFNIDIFIALSISRIGHAQKTVITLTLFHQSKHRSRFRPFVFPQIICSFTSFAILKGPLPPLATNGPCLRYFFSESFLSFVKSNTPPLGSLSSGLGS